jgi:hypothetical protein
MPGFPASHRLRFGRYDELNRIYLLTANTLNREPVFRDFALGRLVVAHFEAPKSRALPTLWRGWSCQIISIG